MTKHQTELSGAIFPEILLEICWGFGLNVADSGTETIANPQQALVRTAVPRSIRDRTGREERDTKRLGAGTFRRDCLALSSAGRQEGDRTED